jgi:hypothetical protein
MMQTIDLGATFGEAGLEGVVLGVVYTAQQRNLPPPAPLKEDGVGETVGLGREGNWKGKAVYVEGMREVRKEEIRDDSAGKTLGCLGEAVKKVGERRQMEGVLEFEMGRVSFLVYRID